jgi:xylulokinase
VSRAKLPEIAPADAVVGTVSAAAARQTGLLAGTPVVAGAGDMLCQLAATGLDRPDRVTEISGTAGVMAAWSAHPHPSPRVLNLRAAGDGWIHFGIADAGGLCLRWVAEELFDDGPAYSALTEQAAAVPAGSNGLLFLPYLLGERTLGSSYARGSIIGVTPRHGRPEIVRAVLEGLCFEMRRSLDAFAAGTDGLRVRACGGGAVSDLWNQIRADVYGLPLCELAAAEGGLLGTALLAGDAAGWDPSVRAAADRLVREKRQFDPGPDVAVYQNEYERFCRAHDALTPFWDG